MARPGHRVRVGILAGVFAWHALLVLLLLQRSVVTQEAPEFVTTWLRLDREPPPRATPPVVSIRPALLVPSTLVPPPPPSSDPPLATPESSAITAPSDVDWYREASRAARDQYRNRLPTPRSLEDKPAVMQFPSTTPREHRRGDQEDLGNGEWKVWVSSRCWTILSHVAPPPPPGQLRAASVRCVPKPSIDAAVFDERKPRYLLEPPLKLPSKGSGAGRPRPGPAMGGTPMP